MHSPAEGHVQPSPTGHQPHMSSHQPALPTLSTTSEPARGQATFLAPARNHQLRESGNGQHGVERLAGESTTDTRDRTGWRPKHLQLCLSERVTCHDPLPDAGAEALSWEVCWEILLCCRQTPAKRAALPTNARGTSWLYSRTAAGRASLLQSPKHCRDILVRQTALPWLHGAGQLVTHRVKLVGDFQEFFMHL